MRPDMFKVIVERPRLGRGQARAVKLKQDPVPDRSAVGLKRHVAERYSDRKMLNENLNPLIRYLFKQRGRVWNMVFADICAQLDTGSTVKMHVRAHIDDYVMRHITIKADGRWVGTGLGFRSSGGPSLWPDLYVDPKDGRLKETRHLLRKLRITPYNHRDWVKRRAARDNPPDMRWLTPTVLLHKTHGLWMRYSFDLPPDLHPDDLRAALVTGMISSKTGRPEPVSWRVIHKQQLSKLMLRQYGLINDAEGPSPHLGVAAARTLGG